MIHYNLRAKDYGAALEMIKRRRILGGAMTTKPILNITKWAINGTKMCYIQTYFILNAYFNIKNI